MKTSAQPAIRVLHVVDDFSTMNTGVTAAVRQLMQWQAGCFDWVGVHAVGKVDMPAPQEVELIQAPASRLTPRWRYPAGGAAHLLEKVRSHRVTHLHIHEFWRGGYVAGMLAAHANRLPVILSAHGSVAPWALHGQGRLKSWKKGLYWKAFGRLLLDPGVVLHAITSLEASHMEDFFGRKPLAVIPNALSLDTIMEAAKSTVLARRFVFLGRLHPVKGVDLLIEAFGNARLDDDWELVISGPEEVSAYAIQLKSLAANSPRASRIHFTGPVYGPEKISLLRSAWAVIVPSHTEVIGMVNLESASLTTPTITTPNTGLDEWAEVGGMLADNNAAALQASLQACAAWPMHERLRRGYQIREHVLQRYSLESVGQEWLRLYRKTASTAAVTSL